MTDTSIEWADAVWNPVRGCSRVSAGCEHCYAERMAARFAGPGMPYEGLVTLGGPKGPRWTGGVRLVPEKLAEPLRWRRPRRVFVNSMSDLFHDDVPDDYIAAVFGVMAACQHAHVFQVLTKRPRSALSWFRWLDAQVEERLAKAPPRDLGWRLGPRDHCVQMAMRDNAARLTMTVGRSYAGPWPLANVWLGVSVEDQAAADRRLSYLAATPAAVRFVSAEPLLGPIDLRRWLADGDGRLDWVIVGGESGPGARPCNLQWIADIVRQCKAAGAPVFVKQLGDRVVDAAGTRLSMGRKGKATGLWPEALCVREFPR